MIKASADLLAKLSVKSQDEVLPALLARLEAAETKNAELTSALAEANGTLAKLATKEEVTAVSNSVTALKFPSEDTVKGWAEAKAKEAGSLAAAVALGKAGLTAIESAPASEALEKGAAAKVQDLLAAGNYAEAFKADPEAKDFSSVETYTYYQKAKAKGQFSVHSKSK